MTEKRYCGECNHLILKGIRDGLPQLYCPIIEKDVSFIGFTCPNFTEKVVSDETDYEIVEIMTFVENGKNI